MSAGTPTLWRRPWSTIELSAEPSKECSRAEKRAATHARTWMGPRNVQHYNDGGKRLRLTLLQSSLPIVHSMNTSLRDMWISA